MGVAASGSLKTDSQYSGTELDAMALAKNYHRWILSQFAAYVGKRVIEVGAGIGTFSQLILSHCDVRELTALEPAENLFPVLQKCLAQDGRVRARQEYLANLPATERADSVILVNVLEHVSDDVTLLETVHRILEPRGTLLLFVPALPWLFGALDEAFEHLRRYTKPHLLERLRKTGYHVETLRYVNLPGVVSWFVASRVLRRRTLKTGDVWLYDRWVVPWVSRLERRWEPPIGQSLIAVARKREPHGMEGSR